MNESPWPKRLYALDATRGIAALSVVFWHWQHFAFEGDILPQGFDRAVQPFYPFAKMLYEKGLLGVDYFFLLSGFIFFWIYKDAIGRRKTSFKEFWVHRLSRLYPLHLVTLCLVALLQAIYVARNIKPFVFEHNDTYHFLLHLGFASNWGFEKGWSFNTPVWSVSIEILLYFIFFLIVYRKLGHPFICLYISLISFAVIIFDPAHHLLVNGLLMFFLGGFVFYVTRLISTKYQNLRFAVYLVAATAWLVAIVNFYFFDFADQVAVSPFMGYVIGNIFPYYVLFPFTVAGIALIEINRGQFLKSISWLGDITYSSYLLHFPLQILFALAVSYGILRADFYLQSGYLVLFFLILVPLSYITFIAFERPMQKLLRKKFAARKQSTPLPGNSKSTQSII